MNKKIVKKEIELGGRTLSLTTGKLAGQADGAVLAQYGETVVLATVVSSKMIEDRGYFPLSVEYQERLYAGGRIKGSRWVKREGKPTDEEILVGRLIDRSIRPLFPKDLSGVDVQVIVTVLSVDLENDPAYIAPIAVSAAIASSSIPWDGPVGVVTVGMRNGGEYFVNPRENEKTFSEMELVVSATDSAIIMIESGSNEVSEEEIVSAIEFGQTEIKKLNSFISDFAGEVGKKKEKIAKQLKDEDVYKAIKKAVSKNIENIIKNMAQKEGGNDVFGELVESLSLQMEEVDSIIIASYLDDIVKHEIRDMILAGKRADGRALDEIRPLSSEVSVLPRTHGSGLFTRGETQVLSIATLGSPEMGQLLESAEGEEEKRYIHHYSMPPYSTGETGRVGSPSRREIGHGALAERALLPVIPSEEEFPYAIRIVSEVMSSNGSTSMASTCGSTLSLMDAGVPIKAPVAGIAMGLVIESEKKYAVLTDIAGIEDFNGDMDFKVTGTAKGITALQLDVKTLNLTSEILADALQHAKVGRAIILKSMLDTIGEPRKKVSTYAPKIKTLKINPEKIGDVIGPGGKTIKKIIADTGSQVDVEDDGTINVSGIDPEGVDRAVTMVEALTKEVQPGEIYKGVVRRIQNFGAFVEILPGKDGLVHVSDMSEEFVKNPEDKVSIGDEVDVRVKEIDDMGRINLSMILDPGAEEKKKGGNDRDRRGHGGGRDFHRGGRRPHDAPRHRQNFRRDNRDKKQNQNENGGPHFPASRLMDNRKGYNR
jgi:polyribonucleotide nucleotidyltransferase